MATEPTPHPNRDGIRRLLYRLRPGDEILVTNDQRWNENHNGPRKMWIWKVAMEEPPGNDKKYYRIHGRGPQQRTDETKGWYILMPEKPAGKGNNPAPEIYHRTTNESADYPEKTKGSITSLKLITQR